MHKRTETGVQDNLMQRKLSVLRVRMKASYCLHLTPSSHPLRRASLWDCGLRTGAIDRPLKQWLASTDLA